MSPVGLTRSYQRNDKFVYITVYSSVISRQLNELESVGVERYWRNRYYRYRSNYRYFTNGMKNLQGRECAQPSLLHFLVFSKPLAAGDSYFTLSFVTFTADERWAARTFIFLLTKPLAIMLQKTHVYTVFLDKRSWCNHGNRRNVTTDVNSSL